MPHDPNVNLKAGVDLSDRAKVSDAKAEAAARQQEAAERAYAKAWDRMVQRAAKGILPRPLRHKMLQRAAARAEASNE